MTPTKEPPVPPTPGKYQSAASKYFNYPWPDEQKAAKPKIALKRVKRVIPRERKHKATSSKTIEGFVSLTKTFSQDGTLSPNAKAVALAMESHANHKTGLVSVKSSRLQEDANLGDNTLGAARQELADKGYVKKIPIRDSAGHIKGWKYFTTNKLVYRATKPLPMA